MPNEQVIIQNELFGDENGYVTEPYASFGSDESRIGICGPRCHSAPQVHDSFLLYSKSETFCGSDGSDDQMALSANPQPSERAFGDIDTASNDDAICLAQPAPRSSGMFMVHGNLAPFAGIKEESLVIPSVTISKVSKGGSQCDTGIIQEPIWGANDMETSALYQTSSDTGSVTTRDSDFTSAGSMYSPTTPLPWTNPGLRTRWDMPCQETSQPEMLWMTTPQVPGLNVLNPMNVYDTGTIDRVTASSHAIHELPTSTGNDSGYTVPPVSLLRNPDYFNMGRDQDVKAHGANQLNPAINTYLEEPYQHDQILFPKVAGNAAHFHRNRFNKRPTSSPTDTKNAFLIECKRRGLSYKDIKRIGGFKEAESTLRGRFRTLTKSKEQRVRKPQWQEKDIRLLCEAVDICSEPDKPTNPHYGPWYGQRPVAQPPKVSWKKVAQYIWSHGGSYHFGNATCKRKWCEVHNVRI